MIPPPSFPLAATARRRRGQRGSGAAGFLLAAVPVLWLGLGGVELAYWMHLRQSLSLILMDAARAGATRNAEPAAMAATFEQGLRRIHPAPGEVARVLQQRRGALGVPWHIQVLQPAHDAFADHADPQLAGPRGWAGQPLIRNDLQHLRHAGRIARGWPQGRGPVSGATIFEANTLTLALRWPHRPLLPGAAALMRALAPLATDARGRAWMDAGYLPFRRQVAVAMHSPPALWADLPDGRITHGPDMAVLPGSETIGSDTIGSGSAAGSGPDIASAHPGSTPQEASGPEAAIVGESGAGSPQDMEPPLGTTAAEGGSDGESAFCE